MQDGHQSVGERRDPAQAGLPQRPAELLFPGAQVDGLARLPVHPVRVPPAAPVAHREEASAGGPLDLRDGLLGSAEHGTGLREPAVRGDLGEPQLGAVPRHTGVVPHQPGRLPPVGREPGPAAEPVPVIGQLPHAGPVFRGRPVQRYGSQDAAHIGRPGSGELLQHAPDFTVTQHRVGPAQPAAHRRDGVSARGAGPPGASGSYAYSRWSAKWTKTTRGPPRGRSAPAQGSPPYSVTRLRTFHGAGSAQSAGPPSAGRRTRARRPPSAGRGTVHHTSAPIAPTYSGLPSREAASPAPIGEGQLP